MSQKTLMYVAIGVAAGYFLFGANCDRCKKLIADGKCK